MSWLFGIKLLSIIFLSKRLHERYPFKNTKYTLKQCLIAYYDCISTQRKYIV